MTMITLAPPVENRPLRNNGDVPVTITKGDTSVNYPMRPETRDTIDRSIVGAIGGAALGVLVAILCGGKK